jgi:2'-5' RNA ligase
MIRRQATLFLPTSSLVGRVRTEFNPQQAELISGHVTLCREDEVSDWDRLAAKFREHNGQSVTLDFGGPERNGDFVFLPCIGSTDSFDRLRSNLLNDEKHPARRHEPHITLIHPRNGVCTDAIFDQIVELIRPFSCTFNELSLIEQRDGGVWTVLESFKLATGKV